MLVRPLPICFATLLLILLPSTGLASPIEDQVRHNYLKKAPLLRHFYTSDDLHYDSKGKLIGESTEGSWTLGRMQINKIKVNPTGILFEGFRVADVYNQKTNHFESIRTRSQMSLRLDIDPNATIADIARALDRVFISNRTELVAAVPECWRRFLSGAAQLATLPAQSAGDASAPVALDAPEPPYDPHARAAGVAGTTVLSVVVDEQGVPGHIQIIRPIGFGLDDRAVEAVSRWKFQPSQLHGQPIAAEINIHVSFGHYDSMTTRATKHP